MNNSQLAAALIGFGAGVVVVATAAKADARKRQEADKIHNDKIVAEIVAVSTAAGRITERVRRGDYNDRPEQIRPDYEFEIISILEEPQV